LFSGIGILPDTALVALGHKNESAGIKVWIVGMSYEARISLSFP